MTFVVSGNRKQDLRKFTGVLFSAFPGTTIYEHTDGEEAEECVRTHRISAVFIDGAWDAENGFRLLRSIRSSGADVPVYMIADNDRFEEDALWYEASGYLIQPVNAEDLKTIVRPAGLCK